MPRAKKEEPLHEIDVLKICVQALERLSEASEQLRVIDYLTTKFEADEQRAAHKTAAEHWTRTRLMEFIREQGGTVTVAQAKAAGAPKAWLHNALGPLVKEGLLVRAERGVYELPEAET